MYKGNEGIQKNCTNHHNVCLKFQLLQLAASLVNGTRLSVGPGMALVSTKQTQDLEEKLQPLAASPLPLRSFLGKLLTSYLGSLNLTFQLEESRIMRDFKDLDLQAWMHPISTGRAWYKRSWYALGTIGIVGFVLLASLCGKALMASVLALVLSSLVALRSTGAGFAAPALATPARVTQYEIISRPAYASAPATHYYDTDNHGTI